MDKAVNDATLTKLGDIYQYYIALLDCFELKDGQTLQIEVNGDVSIISNSGEGFQKEVKHHLTEKYLTDRDIDFWKTVANWYEDYERIEDFSEYILSTTAIVKNDSSFYQWNKKNEKDKLACLKMIGQDTKSREETFRKQYDRIFTEKYDENRLLKILNKFNIVSGKTKISGISQEFSKYIRPIPKENRDGYIDALLGSIEGKVKDPPHRWEVTKDQFDEMCQRLAAAYGAEKFFPLPKTYENEKVPAEKEIELRQKEFVKKIQDIRYDIMIPLAIEDYWKTDLTVHHYFRDDVSYLQSLEHYRKNLENKLWYAREEKNLEADGATEDKIFTLSKQFYSQSMQWRANDFESIIRNQNFFQHGVIHNIMDENKNLCWKVGEENDEHK